MSPLCTPWILWICSVGPGGSDSELLITANHQTHHLPAVDVDEGHLRSAPPSQADAGLRIGEFPPRGPEDSADNGGDQGTLFDVATGSTHSFPLRDSLLREAWTRGRQSGHADDERNYQGPSWTSDLSMINNAGFPWGAQCRITYTDSATGLPAVASGTLVDAQHVITAAHVVHGGQGGNWNSNHQIYPAWDGTDDAYGSAYATAYAVMNAWVNNGDPDYDLAWIRLSRPVGFLTDWFGYGYSTDDNFYSNNYFNLAGFPSDCYTAAPDQLYYGFGLWDTVGAGRLYADTSWSCDPGPGLDGGGSYVILSSERFVYAVHADYCDGCNEEITHTRMNSSMYNFFEGTVIPGSYSSSDRDHYPMDVNVADEVLYAGDQLSGMDYLVGNRSLFDPGSETVSVSVYLSTNNNISTFDTLLQTHTFTADFDPRGSERITVATPPTIPDGTPSGQYWIGIIVESTDQDTSNNDTDGWDAAPILIEGCSVGFVPFGVGFEGSGGYIPVMYGTGDSCQKGGHTIHVAAALGGTYGNLWVGFNNADIPFYGGRFYIDFGSPWITVLLNLQGPSGVPGAGFLNLPGGYVPSLRGISLYLQMSLADAGAIRGVSLTNGLEMIVDQ